MDKALCEYLANLVLNNEYISRMGWIKSIIEEKVIDANGNPIPWYAYPAIDILTRRQDKLSQLSVFEFGCGYGTQWWASRAKRVTIIEHDKEWFDKMTTIFPPNVRPIYKSLERGGEYCKILNTLLPIKFNIIIIDGRDRVNCCYNSLSSLTDDGIIIFDNSNREEYEEGKQYIRENGFKELQLFGFTPMVPIVENATSFFYRPNNCLDF